MSKDEKECIICKCDQKRQILLEVKEIIDTSLSSLDRQLIEERKKALEEQVKAEEK